MWVYSSIHENDSHSPAGCMRALETAQKKGRGGKNSSTDSGLYQLVIQLGRRQVIDVGHLGRFAFPSGYYVYTGSAKLGLESRIARHLRKEKRLRWHIDYLLGQARIVEVKRYHGGRHSECELSRRVRALPGGKIVAPGFGSSDCRCSTHLFHFRRNPARELGPEGEVRSRFEDDLSTNVAPSRGLHCRRGHVPSGALANACASSRSA